ncbi:hypothetical protein GCM10027521_61670 [Amycolatopsis cihanbeyliensis]
MRVHRDRYFALDGSDYPSHETQEAAIARYIRWRNKHAQPKRRFAIGSKSANPITSLYQLDAALHLYGVIVSDYDDHPNCQAAGSTHHAQCSRCLRSASMPTCVAAD